MGNGKFKIKDLKDNVVCKPISWCFFVPLCLCG